MIREPIADLQRQLDAALRVCRDVKTWCELNRREGSVLYKPACDALAMTPTVKLNWTAQEIIDREA
jgi:hypothetical protein